MNEEKNPRAHEFACWIGIDYQVAELVTNRIPKEIIKKSKDGKEKKKDGDGKVFAILSAIAERKKSGGILLDLSPAEEIDYLKEHGANESLGYLSYTATHHLYHIYKILEVIGDILPPEINPKDFSSEEVEALTRWLFP